MNEFIFLFVTLAVVGLALILLKRFLELEAERKITHILAWCFFVIGVIGSIATVIGYGFIATP